MRNLELGSRPESVKTAVTTLSDDLKELKESLRVSSEDTKKALLDLGNRVSVIEKNKEATETCLLYKLTEKMRVMIGNDDCKSRNEYFLGEIVNESKKLGIAGIKGTLDNYEAVH